MTISPTDQNHSAARIISQAIQDHLLTKDHTETEWASFVSSLPDDENSPDEAICVYDSAGFLDGRSMQTGLVYRHPGVAIHVRSIDYDLGLRKAEEIFRYMGEIKGELVFVEAGSYRINSVTMTSSIIPLGESEVRSRRMFSLNGVVSITNLIEE